MNFELEPKYKMIREVCRKFADAEIEPVAAENDALARFPEDIYKRMGELGIMGVSLPKEYGGAGAGYTGLTIAVEEIAKSCAATAAGIVGQASLTASILVNAGTPEQKEKWLRPLADGSAIGAFGLTEPNAGSDAANQQTRAEDMGDYYLLNGSKVFITNGHYADICMVIAMTDPSLGLKGCTAFVLEKGMPGFTYGTKENKMGIRSSCTSELVFQDVKVPKANQVGKIGQGFKLAMQSLDAGRMVVAAQALGIAEAAFDEALRYAKERIQFKRPIAKQQIIQFYLADMATEIECARGLIERAAWGKDNGFPYAKQAAMAKVYCSELASRCANKAVQIHGGYGYMKDYKVERLFRDARITEIYEGTSEIQRTVIAGYITR